MQTRRDFVEFMGRGLAFGLTGSQFALGATTAVAGLPFTAIKPSGADEVVLAEGFVQRLLMKEGDAIFAGGARFGSNNDFLAMVPFTPGSQDDLLLWVNHEDLTPLFVSGYDGKKSKTKAQVDVERESVGGSIVRVRRDAKTGWAVVPNDPHNRRITATTQIPLIAPRAIAGSKVATGTLGNCAGGKTTWGTILTAEENYQNFYGEVRDGARSTNSRTYGDIHHGWDYVFDHSPEHYGWIVEVDVRTGAAKKLTALGRFAHEGALVVQAKDGRSVVYMGDDAADQCIYKFISAKAGSLEQGELFVANTTKGEWVSLDRTKQPALQERFKDQTDVLLRTRVAADLVGGTKLDRPEDIKQDPVTKAMIVSLTNNKRRGNMHGGLFRIDEDGSNPLSMRFKSSTFRAGGPETGFSCPDNFVFDARGNLWLTSDISSSSLGKGDYASFRNNGLFYLPLNGPHAGQVHQVASAPNDAEFTGPCFSPDHRTLFLSVQHPGEESKDSAHPTSRWPEGAGTTPKSAVIALSGPALDALAPS